MTSRTHDELAAVGEAKEPEIAPARVDGSLRRATGARYVDPMVTSDAREATLQPVTARDDE